MSLSREISRTALNHLHVGNRFRLMFGHPVDETDPGYPAFKAIISGQPTPKNTMTKTEAIAKSKEFRQRLDQILQDMKEHQRTLINHAFTATHPDGLADKGEVIANHTLSFRAVEDAIMRQGMVLKNAEGAGYNPYPASYDPNSPVVEPTSGVKL